VIILFIQDAITPADSAAAFERTGLIRRVYTLTWPGLRSAVAVPAQGPNQRLRRVETKRSLSPASSRDGPKNGATGDGPDKKSASTLPTSPPPNSM
jgi:hypothetical protein